MAITVALARHTLTDFNKRTVYSGQLDPPLCPDGVRQALALRERLKGYKFTRAYCSDLIRSVQASRIALGGHGGVELIEDPLLRELDVGVGAGMSREGVLTLYGNPLADTRHPECDFADLGGESKSRATWRYTTFFRSLTGLDEKELIFVGVHGTVLRFCLELRGIKLPAQGDFVMVSLGQLVNH